MYTDEALIPIAALQHDLFCPRQCALIHIDGLWSENRLTAQGQVLHRRVDSLTQRTAAGAGQSRAQSSGTDPPGRIRVVRAMPLVARRLGLVGKADTVEFPVARQRKCRNCSLVNLRLPAGTEPTRSPKRYFERAIGGALAGE